MNTPRQQSFWGWGWADRFPPAEERRRLGQLIGALLGLREPLEPRPAPTLGSITIPEPRLTAPEALAAFCTTDRHERARRTYGRGYADLLRGFRGDFSPAPDLVATPADEAQIEALLSWAASAGVAVVPFGGGTSVVAGTEPEVGPDYAGTVSLDMGHLDQLLEVDHEALLARIQAGVKGPHMEAQLAAHGLTLRHFPQSFEFSTLGGWIATRSGGHFATLYTHIDELVASARMVTPSGVLESPRLPASGAGPDPNRLICGSEGILGVITEAWMRVRPRPRWRSKATAHFKRFEDAVAAAREIAQTELYPANCRVLSAREALLHGAGTGAHHLLLLGFESSSGPTEAWMARAVERAEAHQGRFPKPPAHTDSGAAQDDRAAGAWRHAFLEAPYRFNNLVSLGVVVDTFETACTWDRFEALHEGVTQAVRGAMREVTGHDGWISCRFTHVYPDGPAPYYTFMAPGRAGEELEQWRAIKTAASDALVEHGGTITHHHAVGRLHKPWHLRQAPPLFTQVLKAAKASLDPDAILNPGVLLDP